MERLIVRGRLDKTILMISVCIYGIPVLKIFISGGISSVLRSDISYYGDASKISDRKTGDIPPPKKFHYGYPHSNALHQL